MFKVNLSENSLVRLEGRRFSDLNLQERPHLQEWLAQTPEALGEELLIIQKEFDGFAGTRERIDLLALDKEGRVVVIENKLDDSGRDVVWQALKYVAYCSASRRRKSSTSTRSISTASLVDTAPRRTCVTSSTLKTSMEQC